MWSSLEHVHEPRLAVRAAREVLRPGGLLVVYVPNLGSWSFRTFGEHWFALDLPRHLTHFTPETLGRTSHDLLANFSLLFVPAGTGIILHAARLEAEAVALLTALIGSTALTIAVAALVFVGVDRLMGGKAEPESGA